MNIKVRIIAMALLIGLLLMIGCAQEAPAPTAPTKPAPTQPAPTTPTQSPASEEVFKWKLIYYAPPQAVYEHFAVDFCDDLREMSNGRLDFTPYPEGALVPAAEMLDAVRDGTVEMADILSAYFSGVMPISNLIYGFPATYRSYEDKVIHHQHFGFEEIETRAYKEQGGVVHLGTDSVDGGYTMVSNKKITKASDIAGMKLRATGAVGLMFEELGASAIFMPGSELYTALATGVVDGLVYGGPDTELEQMKFAEVVDYLVMPYMLSSHGHSSYIVNPDAWDTLPDDLKAMIRAEVSVKMGSWFPDQKYQNQEIAKKYTDNGMVEICTLPDEEFSKVAQAARTALEKLVADKNDPYLTEGAESLVKFMEWRGYW